MKKLLALVLALVMTLGLATVGTNAALSDLKDADKIKGGDFEEAITVVEAVGVMVGDNNNNFEPTKALTRAEGAMIAARLIATNKVAASLTGNGKKFSDVPANFWNGNGSGVIEYCAANGILNGVGNGKFDPNGALSTVAFAKMMLTSLGYDSNVEGYVNNVDWQTNVMTRAQRIGLMKGLDNVMANDQLTREQAAQMVFNALKTPIVEYDAKIAVSVNGADVSVGNTNAKPVTNEERAKQTIYSNRVNAQQAGTNGAFVVEFAEQYYPGLVLTADTDVFGRPASTWTYGRNELGTWANGDLFVKEWTEEVDGDTVYNTMGALAYKNYPKEVWVDGVELTGTAKTAIVDEIKKDGDTLGETGQGVLTELYVYDGATDATSYARLVIINTYLAKALTSYASKNVSLGVYDNSGWDAQVAYTASETYVDDDLTGIKADDYVLVTMTDPRTDKAVIRSVKPAETMENTYVSAYTANKAGTKMTSITVDGTKINVADKAKWKHEILSNFSLETLKGFTYNVYLDIYGNVIGIDYHTLDTNFVFVVGTDTKGSNIYNTTYTAKMIFLDGTSSDQTVTLAKTASDDARTVLTDDGTNQNKGNAHVNAWFAFSKADDGAIILRNLVPFTGDSYKQYASEVVPTANIEIDSAHTTLPISGGKYAYGNDDSIYISVETDKSASIANGNGVIKGVTGMSKGIKNTSLNSESTRGMTNFSVSTTSRLTNDGHEDYANAFYLYKGNYIVGAVVVGTNAGVARNYIYVISGPSSRQYNGRYLDTYSVIVEGEKKTIEVDSQKTDTTDNKLASNRLHQVAYDKDDIVVEVKNPTTGLAKRLATTLNTNDNKTKGYVYTPTNNNVTVDGYTMTINADGNNTCYVVVAEKSNATFWVQTPGTSTYTQYGDLKTAYGQATRKDAEKGTRKITSVSAVIDGATGFANEVIFTTSYTATGVAFGDDVVVINKAGVGIYDGVKFYTPDAHTITYAEARAALLDQIKSDLPNSDPVFVATNRVEFTMNGKTVSATIAAFGERNATSIYDDYQVYKVTYVNGTESTSAYVDRYAFDSDLAAALRAENSSTAYTAGDNVTVSYVVPGDDPSDIVMINNARFQSKKAYNRGTGRWTGDEDYCKDLIVTGGTATARLQAIINNSQSDVIVLDTDVLDGTKDLKIPEGKTLVLKDNADLTVKDLTVNGKLVTNLAGDRSTITAANVTIDGEEALIWAPSGTLTPGGAGTHNAILKNGSTVIILDVGAWDNVVINCTLQVNGDITATNVFLTGADEDGSVLELNSTTTQTIANVYFGYTLDKDNTPKKATPASATVLELPENAENAEPAKLTKVFVNGDTAEIVNDAVIGTLELNKSAKVALNAEKDYATSGTGNVTDGIKVTTLKFDGASEATFDTDKVVVAGVISGRPAGDTTSTVTLPTGTTTDGENVLNNALVTEAKTVKAEVKAVGASSSNVYFISGDTITVSFNRTVKGATVSTADASNWEVRTAGQDVIATYKGSPITSSGSVTIENVAPASVETGEKAGTISVTVTIDSNKRTSHTER